VGQRQGKPCLNGRRENLLNKKSYRNTEKTFKMGTAGTSSYRWRKKRIQEKKGRGFYTAPIPLQEAILCFGIAV